MTKRSTRTNALSDKEVGELWKYPNDVTPPDVVRLIRKLVEERADNIEAGLSEYTHWVHKDCVESALKDFGIKEEEYT